MTRTQRRFPHGAEILAEGASFRIWAPDYEQVHLVRADGSRQAMSASKDGFFELLVPGMAAGDRYGFALGADGTVLPDPASRAQPDGVEKLSALVDADAFRWSDSEWRGPSREAIYYELHVGTFTPEGTFAAAAEKLDWLVELGVTVIELMPVNAWNGEFGWGYDGTLWYAPHPAYGSPDDLRRLVGRAHALGLGVILDVVYNHFGPGEIASRFAKSFFSQRDANEWGETINFDGTDAGPVREFVLANAAYWIEEFHFDGLRIDATQALLDDSDEHIVAGISRVARAAAGDRRILLVSENQPQDIAQIRPLEAGGYGLDALWNDDFHHTGRVALTGRREGYFHDHRGRPQEFVSAAKYGYLFQGQRHNLQDGQRGTPGLDAVPANFVHFLQNHDQIANTPGSRRIGMMAQPTRMRALTALTLLGPQAPMLFQGQEFGATTPFTYFADQKPEQAELTRKGRGTFLKQFPSYDQPEALDAVPRPSARETFEMSKLDWREADQHHEALALHKDLLRLRRELPRLKHAQGQRAADGAVIDADAFLIRFFAEDTTDDCLLMVNLGADLSLHSLPEPLYAPPAGSVWAVHWSSEDVRYGGSGQRDIDTRRPWLLTAATALLFTAKPADYRTSMGEDRDQWDKVLRWL